MPATALAFSTVDPASPIPLYYQVESDLRRLIGSGALGPGEAVPPELDLCRTYGVSRQTVRLALSRLESDDLITRSAGRGTVVKATPDRARFYLDRSFTRQMAEMGRTAHSRVLFFALGTVDASSLAPLAGKQGAPCLYLDRLRLGDSEPIGIQRMILLTERCPGIGRFNFGQESLYEVLSREYRLVITEIRHTVGAALAEGNDAGLLEIAGGSPVLVVRTTAYLDDGFPIEHTTSLYRADRYEYSTTHIST